MRPTPTQPNPRRRRLFLAAIAALTAPARAAFVDWATASGSFFVDANWSPAHYPAATETPRFNTGATAPYTVSIPVSGYSNAGLSVPHDNVVLNLLSHTYTLTGTITAGSAAGASLTVSNGALSSTGATLAASPGDQASYSLSAVHWTSATGVTAGFSGTGSISLANASTLDILTGSLTLAFDRLASASLSLDGPATAVNFKNPSNPSITATSVIVGYDGDATLSLTNGAKINYAGAGPNHPVAYVAYERSSTSSVSIDGTGSTFSDLASVGNAGHGSVTVSNGGTLTSPSSTYAQLGTNSTATGSVTLDGPASTWTAFGAIVGAAGQGSLAQRNDAKSSITYLHLANSPGSAGSLSLDGAGTRWTGAELWVGGLGAGSLSVTNGALCGSGAIVLGHDLGSSSTATIDGPNSTLATTTLDVGHNAPAPLAVRNGATLSTTTLTLAASAPGAGASLSLDGPGTTCTIAGTASFAVSGQAAVSLTNGAKATSAALSFASDNSYTPATPNTLTITGPGSSWTNATQYSSIIGSSANTNLSISNGGSLTTRNARIGSHATVTIDGPGSSWNNSQSFAAGVGSVALSNGGSFTNSLSSGALPAALTITGTNSKWTDTSSVVFAGGSSSAPYSLSISNGGLLSAVSVNYFGNVSITGPSSAWTNASSLFLNAPNSTTSSILISAGGSLSSTTGTLNARTNLSLTDPNSSYSMSGNLTVSFAASLSVANGASLSNASATLNGSGTFPATASLTGPNSSWSTAGSLSIGGTPTAAGGPASLSLANSAAASVTGTLRLWNVPNTSLSLATASLNAASLALNAAPGPSSPGSVSLTGAALALGSGALYLGGDANGPTAPATLTLSTGGSISLAGPLVLWNAPTSSLSFNGGSLSLATAASLLILDAPISSPASSAPLDVLREQLHSARITTPLPNTAIAYFQASTLNLTSYAGLPVFPTALLTKFTLPGDANLNGHLDPDDYALLDRALAQQQTNPHWTDGDFNYDGIINDQDYLLIDQSLYAQTQHFNPGFLESRESQFGPAYASALLASLPEPTSLLAACGLAFPLLPRRQRHRTQP